MGKKRDKLAEVTFACDCGHRWQAAPDRVEDWPDDEKHPWAYFAHCVECGNEAEQDGRERGLLRAWASATGPKTPEGLARTTKNLEGHPTPEETRLTRFNAMKHGVRAEVAMYFPAKPGEYPHCDGCPYFDNCHRGDACQRRTELFLRHHIAFQANDPAQLREDNARLQGLVRAMVEDMFMAIFKRGVEIVAPKVWFDKDGDVKFANYTDDDGVERFVEEVNAHPLIKPLKELIAANNMALGDAGMTERVQEDQGMLRGHLDREGEQSEAALEYDRRKTEALEGLHDLILESRKRVERDPVLIEHQRQEGE